MVRIAKFSFLFLSPFFFKLLYVRFHSQVSCGQNVFGPCVSSITKGSKYVVSDKHIKSNYLFSLEFHSYLLLLCGFFNRVKH